MVPLEPHTASATAQRWGYANAQGLYDPQLGEIGVISSVTRAFCHSCTRARLSTEGQLYLCLFAHQGVAVPAMTRSALPSRPSGHSVPTAILSCAPTLLPTCRPQVATHALK